MDFNKVNPKFMDFMYFGLDHGIDSIREKGGPLNPFVMTQCGEQKALQRFVTENYQDGIKAAEESIKFLMPRPDFALIAYDGYMPWEGKKYDAIFVRAFDKNAKEGLTFLQRYVPKATNQGYEPIGNAAFLKSESNLIGYNVVLYRKGAKENQKKHGDAWQNEENLIEFTPKQVTYFREKLIRLGYTARGTDTFIYWDDEDEDDDTLRISARLTSRGLYFNCPLDNTIGDMRLDASTTFFDADEFVVYDMQDGTWVEE